MKFFIPESENRSEFECNVVNAYAEKFDFTCRAIQRVDPLLIGSNKLDRLTDGIGGHRIR